MRHGPSRSLLATTLHGRRLTTTYEARPLRYAFLKAKKAKGYAQLQTSHGNVNLELHVDSAPRACENFVRLIEKGYYKGVIFHRLLRNFMVQVRCRVDSIVRPRASSPRSEVNNSEQ